MNRKDLLEILEPESLTTRQLAAILGRKEKDVECDLEHLLKSLPHLPWECVITPARCLACQFEFSNEKTSKPSKCPRCRATRIQRPSFQMIRKPD